MNRPPPIAACISLEPWDDVWRRNQHLAARLVERGVASRVVFVGPPIGGVAVRARQTRPLPGVEAVTAPLVVPRRAGGNRVIAWWLRRLVRGVDVLWLNDPVLGATLLSTGLPAFYDVTDDWRAMPQREADRHRIVAAEAELARRVPTVVCSDVLALRWRERYGVNARVVRNGVDTHAVGNANRRELAGRRPHAVYVGTLHANRIDVSLVAELAASWPGTVHLVGPQRLTALDQARLSERGVDMPGAILPDDVPSWLVSADVLICPHLVDDFTLSLDAIKSHEYLATDRPVVATPSSGFQSITAPGLMVCAGSAFVTAVRSAEGTGPFERNIAIDWDARATEFGHILHAVRDRRAVPT